MSDFTISGVYDLPTHRASAAFTSKTSEVFKEDDNIAPVIINERMQYIPWGADNQMPYNIINLIESDETLSTCQMFNAEVCYGSGLVYDTTQATAHTQQAVDDFTADNDLATYFLGVCQDFKHFGFAVSVILLNEDGTRIVRILRKEACYVRFAPADKSGTIPYILYANWRNTVSPDAVERIELLNTLSPLADLQQRIGNTKGNAQNHSTFNTQNSTLQHRKFAVLTRIPTPDSTY